ncbi:MAG: hypothetical protein IT242_08975 [Bacteroidia bacterium]|nr:hypothetical protein [Bacteroidia bacterium]
MGNIKNKLILFTAVLMLSFLAGYSCSTYKVTVGGKTMYGMNYDSWFSQPRIWFETNGYGAVFTGANYQGGNDLTPQSGMNEHGLSFGTLATPTPDKVKSFVNKKPIQSRSKYLKDILHSCKNVEEVKAFIEEYDHSTLSNDVFIYTDKSGKYLIVEPYELIPGNDNKYVLANFCPSTITDFSSIKQQRYVDGAAFLKDKIDTSLAFCTALSDSMHVCRKKIGDGTLLTSIWDLSNGIVHLYFYHDYKHMVQFNLKDELSKGNHSYVIASLFPANIEYQKFLDFQTPLNNNTIDWFLRICLTLFIFSFFYFLISYFQNRKTEFVNYKLLLSSLSLCLAYYMFVLATEMGIFYYPSPYKNYKFGLIDIASYLPFLLILLIVPLLIINRKVIKLNAWRIFSRFLFTANSIAYLILIALFFYWGFYNILNQQ